MARAAAASALLNKELNGLSGSSVETSRNSEKVKESVKGLGDEVDKTSKKTRVGGQEIDRYSGRLRLLTDALVTLGPVGVPIAAVTVPAVVALAGGLASAAGAVGVAVVAFSGLGDALDALNEYQLAPTAANLEKMQAEMTKLGPAGAGFVHFIDDLEPQLRSLQELTRVGLFPGVEKGITSLLTMLPQVQQIIFSLANELGHLTAEAGAGLAGQGFSAFFDYLATDAAPTLAAFGHTIGNVAMGLGSLIAAFAPLSRDFSSGMEAMSASFARWAAGLAETDGFQSFVAYVRESGPQVLEMLGAIATAFIDIAVAAAPVAAAVVPALTALAEVLSIIAESPIGPAIFTATAALLALNRATLLASAGFNKLKVSAEGASLSATKFGAGVSFVAILTGIGAVNAAFNQLGKNVDENSLSRNLDALSRGETVENLQHIGKYLSEATSNADYFSDKLSDVFTLGIDTSTLEGAQQEIEKVDGALAALVESGQAVIAQRAFSQIAAQADEAGVSLDDVKGQFDAYQTALGNAQGADKAAAAQRRYTDALSASGRVNQITRAQIEALNDAMEEQTSAALGAFDAVTQYARALDEAQKRAKHTNAGIDENTKAGQKNRDVLSQLAGAWNNQGDAVRNNMGKWQAARGEFIAVAKQMGVTGDEARALADKILEIPKQRQIDIKLYGSEQAATQIERIRQAVMEIPREWSTTYYVNQVNRISKPAALPGSPDGLAGGGPIVGPGTKTSDDVPIMASRGEFMMRAAAVDHYGLDTMFKMNALHLAAGGPTSGGGAIRDSGSARRSLDDQLAIAQILQQIQGYRQSLNKDGKDKLDGLNRKIAELQLKAAEKELRLAQTRELREQREKFIEKRDTLSGIASGFSFDSLLPSQPQTVAQGVAAEIADFKSQILDAGGTWTKAMQKWARDMGKAARQYDEVTEAIAAEEKKRDDLTKVLADQQNQLDQLNSTMASYSASVANNFLRNPFGGARTDSVDGAPGAASAALTSAQAQLAAIRGGAGGDSVAAAALAADLIAQIKILQAQADAETAPQQKVVTGLDALRETLLADTSSANRMAAALAALAGKGLDTSGPLGGLYQQLAASGDFATAEELANLSAEQIDEYEKLFAAREDAAALVAAQATQAVYGEQQAQWMAQVAQTTDAITSLDAGLAILNATQAVLGEQVRLGAQSGIALLQPQIGALTFAIGTLAAQFAEQKKKDKV